MSGERYLWRYYCDTTTEYETVVSENPPVVCPYHGGPIQYVTKISAEFNDMVSDGYILIESKLADNQAVRILASDTNGGILVSAGNGGITTNSTNTISMNAAAQSNLSTTVGNIDVEAVNAGTGGLVNVDGDSGVNIGSDQSTGSTVTPIVNIGTGVNAKTVNIGNTASKVNINSGTGTDIISSNRINIISSDSTGSAVNIESFNNNGGISMTSGSQGTVINSVGGALGIGNFNGGDVLIGTSAHPRSILVGNTETGTRVKSISGVGVNITTQVAESNMGGGSHTLTVSELMAGVITFNPLILSTCTLPSAGDLAGELNVNEGFVFSIINLSLLSSVAVSGGAGGSVVGDSSVNSDQSGMFRLRMTGIGPDTYSVHRIA